MVNHHYLMKMVAKGACIFSELWRESKDGDSLLLNKHSIYIDELTSITLNVQVSRDLCWPFLEKGKPINGQQITVTFQDKGRTGTTVYNILEGDSDKKCNNVYNYVKDCSLLKSYSIKYAPEDRGPNGAIEYLFIFSIETDGVISLEIIKYINLKRNNSLLILFVFLHIQLSFQNKSVLKWIFYIFYYNQLYIIQNEIS